MKLPHLNRRLILEAPSRTADGAGGYGTDWVARAEVWAEVAAGSGNEKTGETGPLSRVSYRIMLRAVPVGSQTRPLPNQRFREGARLFHIRAVSEADAHGHYLMCFADEEVVA